MLIYVCDTCGCKIEDPNENKWAHKKRYYTSRNATAKIEIELNSIDKDYCSDCYSKIAIEAIKEYLEILSGKEV